MNKKLAYFFLLSLMVLSLVSSLGNVVNIPDDVNSFEEFKLRVLEANQGDGFFAVTGSNYWGSCERTCSSFIFSGDCNPCNSGEVASMRTWHPDSMSVMNTWTSGYSYCNDVFKPYNYYNQQALCTIPSTECSGGADPGDKKCDDGDVWKCSNSGVWEYYDGCDYGCSSGSCEQEQCIDNYEKKCDSGSVYWYDSCGDRQNEYERCDPDEVCQNARCEKVCQDGFIGEKLCSGNQIVQQYQTADCLTEIKTVETCTNGCENSICVVPQCSSCPDPTAWSQCNEGTMYRTNYKCDSSSNYNCASFTEQEVCECGTSDQCNYNEICESSVCSVLECAEGEIADNHECIAPSSFSVMTIIWVVVGFFVLLFMGIIAFLIIKLKGGKNNGK